MKECVIPEQRGCKAKLPKPQSFARADTDANSLSPRLQECRQAPEAALGLKAPEDRSKTAVSLAQKQKQGGSSGQDEGEKSPQFDGDEDHEVGLWLEKMPLNLPKQLDPRFTQGSPEDSLEQPDRPNMELLQRRCSEGLLQAVRALKDIIAMQGSLPAKGRAARTRACPNFEEITTYRPEEAEYDEKCPSVEGLQDEVVLTPGSLDYVTGSNYNIWLNLNGFDLDPGPCFDMNVK